MTKPLEGEYDEIDVRVWYVGSMGQLNAGTLK